MKSRASHDRAGWSWARGLMMSSSARVTCMGMERMARGCTSAKAGGEGLEGSEHRNNVRVLVSVHVIGQVRWSRSGWWYRR